MLKEEEKEHYMKCGECGEWFDMRDLNQLFSHEHWMKRKPHLTYSHVKKVGRDGEVYIKVGEKMITLKEGKQKR